MQSTCCSAANSSYNLLTDLWDGDAPADLKALGVSGGDYYEEYLFKDRLLEIVDGHDADSPLALVYTPHVAHCPLQVRTSLFSPNRDPNPYPNNVPQPVPNNVPQPVPRPSGSQGVSRQVLTR